MGRLAGITGQDGGVNSDGDQQKDIDVAADAMMRARVARYPGRGRPFRGGGRCRKFCDPAAPLCVAIDPLDGSANLENNISVGTIFSIRPRGNDILSTFFEPGTAQCAAGFIVYGPQTTLVLALNARVDIFILDRRAREFLLIRAARADCARHAGIRHQRLEPAALAWAGARLYRRMPRRHQRRRRGRFQHALDRLAGCGVASHPGARRRVPLPGRCPARDIAREGFACCTKRIRWRW